MSRGGNAAANQCICCCNSCGLCHCKSICFLYSSLTAARQQINIRKYRRHRSLVVPNKTDRSFSCDHTIIYKWWPAEFAHTLIELLPEAVIHSLNWVERRALIRKRRLTVRQFTNYSVGNVGLCDVTAHWHSIMQDNSFRVQLLIFSISTVSDFKFYSFKVYI